MVPRLPSWLFANLLPEDDGSDAPLAEEGDNNSSSAEEDGRTATTASDDQPPEGGEIEEGDTVEVGSIHQQRPEIASTPKSPLKRKREDASAESKNGGDDDTEKERASKKARTDLVNSE